MKKLLILCVLFLSSCIWVDDFGEYWDKGEVDAALEGSWALDDGRVPVEKQESSFRFEKSGKEYSFKAVGKNVKDDATITVRSVHAKHYHFMMSRKEQSGQDPAQGLVRYAVDKNKLTIYEPHTSYVMEWVKEKYPSSTAFKEGGSMHAGFVSVPKLNEEALGMLDKVPDEEKYWKSIVLRKLK